MTRNIDIEKKDPSVKRFGMPTDGEEGVLHCRDAPDGTIAELTAVDERFQSTAAPAPRASRGIHMAFSEPAQEQMFGWRLGLSFKRLLEEDHGEGREKCHNREIGDKFTRAFNIPRNTSNLHFGLLTRRWRKRRKSGKRNIIN